MTAGSVAATEILRAGSALVLVRDLVNAHDDGEVERELRRLHGRAAQRPLPELMSTWRRLRGKAAGPADHWSLPDGRTVCRIEEEAAEEGTSRRRLRVRISAAAGSAERQSPGLSDDDWLDMPIALPDTVRRGGIGPLQIAAHVLWAIVEDQTARDGDEPGRDPQGPPTTT